jgi:predicted GIY-YIG superfamily endonuclease
VSTPTALYRLFGDSDDLLYIGISGVFGKRWHQHSKAKAWWTDVRRATLDWHLSWESALDAEESAIKAEHPRYNVVHNARELEAAPPLDPLPAPPVAPVQAQKARRPRPVPKPTRTPAPERHLVGIARGLTSAEQDRLPVSLSLAQAARVIGIDRRKARELAVAGEFPCYVVQVGRDYVVPTFTMLNTLSLGINLSALRALMGAPKADAA